MLFSACLKGLENKFNARINLYNKYLKIVNPEYCMYINMNEYQIIQRETQYTLL